jgi:hypothetical protein
VTGEVLKICGGALLCVIAIIVLRSMGRELHLPLQWTGIVALTGAAVVLLQPILAWLSEVAVANGKLRHLCGNLRHYTQRHSIG